VAQDPDKWLTMGTFSAGGGHWSDFIREVGRGGGGSIALTQRPIKSYINLQGEFIPHADIFYIGRVKNLRFW
jgi:hypothetical protein